MRKREIIMISVQKELMMMIMMMMTMMMIRKKESIKRIQKKLK